jgi:ribonuclease HI
MAPARATPGPGGWGAWLRSGAHEKELWGGEPHTTNNRMELTAVIEALASLKRRCRWRSTPTASTCATASRPGSTAGRRAAGLTADRKPVKNADLWQRLDALREQHDVQWHWVKGHAGDPGNERADALANRGVASAQR